MADFVYNSAKEYMVDGTFNLKTGTFYVMLLKSTYTPSATHVSQDDLDILSNEVPSNEVEGTGYYSGGQALTGVTWTRSTATCTWDANDSSWTSATFTARYAVIYYTPGGVHAPTEDLLLLLFDFGANKTVTAGTFTLQYNVSGIITLT